jgi:antitoxin component YwqK of YwqJK toxin-antitoxin module
MGKVIELSEFKKNHEQGFKKYLHKGGWERGFRFKGNWHGPYESLGILKKSNSTYHCRGFYKEGLRSGQWEMIVTFHNIEKPNMVKSGMFVDDLKEGEWINIFENGKKKVIEVFKNGERIEESKNT